MKRLLAFLLFASPLFATPVQTVLKPVSDPNTVFTIPLAPTKPGDFLFIYGFIGTTAKITDSQNNVWLQVNSDYADVFYVPASMGGAETITVTFPSPSYLIALVYEFAGSYVLADVIPSRCWAASCNPVVPGQSLNYQENTTTPCPFPLTTSVSNELVINYFDAANMAALAKSEITAAPGFSVDAFVNNFFAQGSIVAAPGVVAGCVTMPYIPTGQFITTGIAGFKPMPACIALTWNGIDVNPETILRGQANLPKGGAQNIGAIHVCFRKTEGG